MARLPGLVTFTSTRFSPPRIVYSFQPLAFLYAFTLFVQQFNTKEMTYGFSTFYTIFGVFQKIGIQMVKLLLLNARSPIVVRVAGSSSVPVSPQLSKALFAMDTNVAGNLTVFNVLLDENTPVPI